MVVVTTQVSTIDGSPAFLEAKKGKTDRRKYPSGVSVDQLQSYCSSDQLAFAGLLDGGLGFLSFEGMKDKVKILEESPTRNPQARGPQEFQF